MTGRPREASCPCSGRRLADLWLLTIAAGYAIAALIGLPLFGDGGYYFFKLAVDAEPVVPNLRYAALLPQLPALFAARLGADWLLLRHVFSVSYAALPVLSVLACWLAVRRRAPLLILFPALSLLVNQINFSGVSELLASLYLVWPLLLLMLLYPGHWAVGLCALAAGPLLLFLHPMAFTLAYLLAMLAVSVGWRERGQRRFWLRAAAWLALMGTARLLWTLLALNPYERKNLSSHGLTHYLLAETPSQYLLLGLAAGLGLAVAVAVWRGWLPQRPSRRAQRLLGLGALSLAVVAIAVGGELLIGDGIKLKAALTFVLGLLLMGLAAAVGFARPPTGEPSDGGSVPAAVLVSPVALAIVLLVLAKSAAWWTATKGLQQVIADSPGACIPFGPQRPYGLQWPWMAIIDDWATPLNALAFRPRGPAVGPVPLLLPDDGCQVLAESGEAYLTSWVHRPWIELEAAFGPLRPL